MIFFFMRMDGLWFFWFQLHYGVCLLPLDYFGAGINNA